LLAVAALLTAAFVASAMAEPQLEIRPAPAPTDSAAPSAGGSESASPPAHASAQADADESQPFVLPGWIETTAAAVCLAIVVVLAGFLLWYVVRDTVQARGRPVTVDKAPPGPVSHVAQVAAALDAGLDQLTRDGSDPRSVVIACWVRLEDAAAAAGTPRRASDAPADYVLRLLTDHQVSRTVLDRFAGVYRQARYSTGPVDDSMRRAAVAALEHLRAELNVGAAS
jgi:hypothetical protein